MILKVYYNEIGEHVFILKDYIIYNNLSELIEDDESLSDYLLKELELDKTISRQTIEDYYSSDEDVLTLLLEVEDEADINKALERKYIYSIDKLKEDIVEKNTIYLFRNFQYSKNVLLAKFSNFGSITECVKYVYENELQFSDLGGNEYQRLNNTYFLTFDDNFDEEDLSALFEENENVETFNKVDD